MDAAIRISAPGHPEALVDLLERSVARVLTEEGLEGGEVSVTLVGDDEIRRLNRDYLDRDRITDVIAFPLFEEDEPVVGDVYIGIDQARRQARDHDISLDEELVRLVVHGTLHVLGHDHPEGEGREESAMYRIQEDLVIRILAESGELGSGEAP